MTLKKAMEIGESRIICSDGTVFEINRLTDGRVMLHHFEKDGERKFNNRFAMTLQDAETYVVKKLGGVAETEAPLYRNAVPERNEKAPDRLKNVKPKPVRHRFEEEDESGEETASSETDNEAESTENGEDSVNAEVSEAVPEAEQGEEDWDDEVTFGEQEEPAEEAEETEPELETEAEPEPEDIQTEETAEVTEEPEAAERKEEHMQTSLTERYSMVYEDVEMTGDIKTKGSILLKGKLTGNVAAGGSIGITGCVQGNLDAKETVEILFDDDTGEAEIVGNITGTNVTIDRGCVVIGDIEAETLVLKGMVKGNIDVKGRLEMLNGAKVKGSIKSRSMVMEDGAMLDGMCVQSYAGDEAPDAFFIGYKFKMTGKPLDPEGYKRIEKEKKEETDNLTVPEILAGTTAERTEV